MRVVPFGCGGILTVALAASLSLGCSSKGSSPPSGGSTTDPTAGATTTTSSTSTSAANPSTTPAAGAATANADVVFASTQQVCDASCTTTTFGIDVLRELHVYGLWKGLTGDHVELRKYYSPDGSLYYQKLVAFSTQASSADKPFEPTAAIPHTRTVQVTKTAPSGAQVVWDYLPVGGTWITQHHMVGTWRVELYLDKLAGTPDVVKSFTLAEKAPTATP